MASKHILLLSSNSSGRGGGERYLVYLAHGLRSLGHPVSVLLSSASYMDGWDRHLAAEGAVVHRQDLVSLQDRPLRIIQSIVDFKQMRRLSAFCRDVSPDGIIVNQQYDEDGLDYLAAAIRSKAAPVAGVMHMVMTPDKHLRKLASIRMALLNKWYERHEYRLILVSKGSQFEFERYYRHPRPTWVVHSGVPYDSFNSQSDPFLREDSTPVMGFIGQFVAQKNLSLLVDAWLEARRRGADFKLLLVGDGPERQRLEEKLSKAAETGDWKMTGWVERPEKLLSAIDLYAMTSRYEGLPFGLLEAAGAGVPSVITDFNGAWDVASYAPWVRVVSRADPHSFGIALCEAVRDLALLRHSAQVGKSSFRDHFSTQRMARGVMSVLGLNGAC